MRRTKKQIINYWLKVISDDYMHFTPDAWDNAYKYANFCQIKEYSDQGVMMYSLIRDIDNQIKMEALLFYIKPEYRGSNLFLTMIKNLETIAIESEAKEIVIGHSVSGYKSDKFNKIFSHFGYQKAGFVKRI